jgi:hypothetical protein
VGDGGVQPVISNYGVVPDPGDSEALSLDPHAVAQQEAQKQTPSESHSNVVLRLLKRADILLVLLLVVGLVGLIVANVNKKSHFNVANVSDQFNAVKLPLNGFIATEQGISFGASSVVINGALKLNDGVVITPSVQPNSPTAGQLYFDQNTNQLAYYNGTAFVPLSANGAVVQSIGGISGQLTLGGGLNVVGNQLTVALPTGVSSFGGQTGAVTLGNGLSMAGNALQNTGVLNVLAGPNIAVTNDGNGNYTVINTGSGTGTVTSGGGTNGTIPLFTGSQNIENSIITQSGGAITVTGNLNVSGALGLGSALSVANGGTGATSLAANGVLVGNGASAISSITAGGSGLCFISTGGAPTFSACPGSSSVTSVNGLTGALAIANASGAGSTITIDNASAGTKGIASFNSTNFSVVSGAVNTIQNIATTASPTFTGVNTNNIAPSGALIVGATNQNLTLQGNASTTLTSTNGANTTTLSFQSPTAAVTYRFATTTAGAYDICTTVGNCVGTGGGVSTLGGTTGTLSKFTGAQTIGDSLLSESGSTVAANGNLNLTAGHQFQVNSVQISSANLSNDANLAKLNAAQTFTGTNNIFKNSSDSLVGLSVQNTAGNQLLTANTIAGQIEIGQSSVIDGLLVFKSAANGNAGTLKIAALGQNTAYTLPDPGAATATICLSTGNCSGASVTLQSAYNNSTSPEITLDSTRGALTVRDNATPLGANLLEVQNNAGSTTYFAVTTSGVSVTGTTTGTGNVNSSGGSLQTNSTTRIDNSGNASNIGNITLSGTISGGTTYSGTGNINTSGGTLQTNSVTRIDNTGNLVNIAAITASGSATIQGGMVTVGTTSQAGSLVLSDGSSNTGTLQTAALGSDRTYTFPDATGVVCLSTGNCAGAGVTLQSAYNNSTDPEVVLDATRGALTIRDNATPLGANLLEVQNNAGSTTYLAVTVSGVSVTGTTTSTGTINSTGGSLQTNNTTRVDNSGNLSNIGTISASGNITTAGNATLQGGNVTVGTTSQVGTLVLSDGSSNTGTFQTTALAANRTYTFPDATGNVCLDTGNCAGAGVTLQSAYNNSTNPEMVLDATRGALTVRDNATPLGANLLEVQNNAGSTTYFAVTTSGVSVTGTTTGTGNVNSSGGSLQTNSTTRIDNSGNASNIGNLTLSGAISGGTTYSGSGNINTSGGSLQTNSTTRIDNSGNLTNIGTISASGNITTAGNATLQGGNVTIGTTIQAGTLVLSDGSSNTGTIQVAALGQDTVYTLPDPGAGTVSICLTTGNCAGSGGGVTGSGTNNRLAKFTSTGSTVGNSTITDNGATVTTSVNLVIQGGTATVGVAGSQAGTLQIADAGSGFYGSFVSATPLGASRTYTLPDSSGTVCLTSGNCTGSGSGSTLQAAYDAGSTITTTNARDIAITLANTAVDSNLTVTTAAGSTSSTTFALADGANPAPAAQLVLVKNNDTTEVLATGISVQSAAGGITTAFDASGSNITNALAIGAHAITGTNFSVTAGGAVTAVGVNAGAGLLQGVAGLTVSGAAISLNNNSNFNTSINTGTSTGTITLGGGSAPLVIDSTNFDVSSAGALSGITTIATSGAINSQTISSAANFTGTVTIQGASALTLGTASANTGAILFKGAGGAGTLTLAGPTTPNVGNFTLSIPAITANANVCTDNSVCTGYQASGNYLVQAPTSTAINTVTPTTASVVGLTVNATNSTSAIALIANQSQTADTININTTNASGTQTNGILFNRNGAGGTTTNGINVTNTAGTLTNGLAFTGTIGTDINRGSGTLSIQGAGGVTVQTGASGTIAIGTTASSSTINIGTISGSNASTVHIADTITGGTQSVFVGSNGSAASVTTILGGASGSGGGLNIGTSGTTTVSIGNTGSSSNSVSINSGSAGSIGIGNTIAQQNVAIGSTATNASTSLSGGSVGGINIGAVGSSTDASTIHIADTTSTSATQAVTIGSSAANANNITIIQGGSNTTQAIQLLPNVSGGVMIGSATGTGTITLGQSTDSNTINIGNGTTANAKTQTVNIATSGTGTGKAVVTVGNANGASSLLLQAGSAGVSLLSGANVTIGVSDTTGTQLVLDTKTGSGDPTGVNGGMYYNSNSNKFRCFQNGGWADCLATAASFIQNGTTVQDPGNINIRSALAGSTTAILQGANGQTAAILNLQTWNGTTNTDVATFNNVGALKLSGTGMTTITAPVSGSLNAKVAIQPFDPGAVGHVLALGVISTANDTSMPIGVFDARTSGNHRPSIGVYNPSESSVFGLNWRGDDTIAYLMSLNSSSALTGSIASAAVVLQSGDAGGSTLTSGSAKLTTGNGTGTNSSSGNALVDVGSATGSGTTGTVNIGTTNASAVTIGAAASTGTITLGQATVTNTINIGNATTATGNTQTINIGTSATGTGKAVITAGNTNDGSSLVLQSGTTGTSLLSTGNVTIGTSDTTGTLLVLDTKTGSGDPTGVAGAMYYNSNVGAFRCYEVDHWRNCLESARTTFHYINDLVSQSSDAYLTFGGSGGAYTGVAAVTGHPGIAQEQVSSNGTVANLNANASAAAMLLGNGDYWRYETVLRIPTLSGSGQTFNFWSGFIDSNGNDDGTNVCFFKYSDTVNSGKWQGYCAKGGTSATCDTTVTVAANTWYRLNVTVNAAGTSVDFAINGVSKCQITTTANIPTTTGTYYGNKVAKTAGATLRTVDVDYIEVYGEFGTSR